MKMLCPSVNLFDALLTSRRRKGTPLVNNTDLQAQLYLQGIESSVQQQACRPETARALCCMRAVARSLIALSSDEV